MPYDDDRLISFEDELLPELTEREKGALSKLARLIVSMGLTTPAIILLESSKPIGFLGSQFFLFFEPLVRIIPGTASISRIRSGLGKREGIEYILQEIEKEDSSRRRKSEKS